MATNQSLFRRKPLDLLLAELKRENRLRRVLGPVTLTCLGVGATMGSGIYVSVGSIAQMSGPAVMFTYIVAGLVCIFAALCYAELASTVPVAGSAYTYTYATFGEVSAWVVGWDLVLVYAISATMLVRSWSDYFQSVLNSLGIFFPTHLGQPVFKYEPTTGELVATGAYIDLPAVLVVMVVTVVLVIGIRASARFNAAMVILNVAVVLFVIMVGAFYVNPVNWAPFAPNGLGGVLGPVSSVFFIYIGFDSLSTYSEEVRNPQLNVPIGIIASFLICMLLYIAVGLVFTGMVNYGQLAVGSPVSIAFEMVGFGWARYLITAASAAGITSVLLVMMFSQSRVLLAMARDGLLPLSFFGKVHERFKTPYKATILTGVFVALTAAFLPSDMLGAPVVMSTLLAFVIVGAAVLVMRKTHPDAPRPFRVPLGPVIPILSILWCLFLMFQLSAENWMWLAIWLGLGLLIYFLYGRKHSHMNMYLAHHVSTQEYGVGASTDSLARPSDSTANE